jgi:hypothetical protein
MMRNAEFRGGYLVEDDLQVVELPYANGDLAMRVAVPDDLAAFEASLDTDEWARISRSLQEGIIDVSLPKWDISSTIDLASPLGQLGVDIPGGNYSRIAPGLSLGQAMHGANITSTKRAPRPPPQPPSASGSQRHPAPTPSSGPTGLSSSRSCTSPPASFSSPVTSSTPRHEPATGRWHTAIHVAGRSPG